MGLVAALGLASAFNRISQPSTIESDTCQHVGDVFDDVWTDEARAELDEIVGKTSVSDNVQRWVDRWSAARTHECEAAKRAGRSLGMSPCLEQQIFQFRSMMRVRVQDRPAILVMLPELPSPEHCIEKPALLERESGPAVTTADAEALSFGLTDVEPFGLMDGDVSALVELAKCGGDDAAPKRP